MLRLSALMAIVVGAVLGVGQLARNWAEWGQIGNWGIDVAAGLMLAVVGLAALRGATGRYLAPAWSFMLALYLGSFLSHQSAMRHIDYGARQASEMRLTAIIGGLVLVALVGFAMSITARQKA